jgi:NAD(P)-dependent dehydrogenase (short-subunit alcohol dehydrogenase family)
MWVDLANLFESSSGDEYMHDELLGYVPEADYLQGKVILLTGAAGGLGEVLAKTYARYGATLVLLDKEVKKLETLYDDMVAAGLPEPIIHPIDMTGAKDSDYEQVISAIMQELGQLDGVVLNAGWLPTFTPFKHYENELWVKVIMSDMQANYFLLKACLPALEKSTDPAIIYSAHKSNKAYFGAFGVATGGMEAMLDILVDEYDQDENFIRINSIDTGPIHTRMRTMNFPGENPQTLAKPQALVGPYLFFMGKDAGKRTGEKVAYERLPADASWAGLS